MPMRRLVYGPLTRTILSNAPWFGRDDFPASQEWANFFEIQLSHIAAQCQFERFRPRLCGKLSQRSGALAEILTSFYFHRNGFKIICYEPEAIIHKPLDLAVQWKATQMIFIEVKAPVWKGELNLAEKHGSRSKQPKAISGEARSVAPVERVKFEIDKALPKFFCTTPNLLVVVPNLFISPLELPPDILVGNLYNVLEHESNRKIGGILLLQAFGYIGKGVELEHFYIDNIYACRLNKLPEEVVEGLIAGNMKLR